MKKITASTLILVMLSLFLLFCAAGCNRETEPVDPMIHNLDTKMHCTIISPEGSIIGEYKAQLVLSITDYANDADFIKITLPLSPDSDFTSDHDRASFTIEHEDEGLPYYCMKANLYHPQTDSIWTYDLAIDIEKECLIFKPAVNEEQYYVVASSNSMIQPTSIVNYFERFLQIYDYSD